MPSSCFFIRQLYYIMVFFLIVIEIYLHNKMQKENEIIHNSTHTQLL